MQEEKYMRRAIQLASDGLNNDHGGPFGAVIVRDGEIIGEGNNRVTSTNDPTAHAEVVAIRDACRNIESFELTDCTIYTSCEPCPMCLSAIYWSKIARVVWACTKEDAAEVDFRDKFIYEELALPYDQRMIEMRQLLREEALLVFRAWEEKEDKTHY